MQLIEKNRKSRFKRGEVSFRTRRLFKLFILASLLLPVFLLAGTILVSPVRSFLYREISYHVIADQIAGDETDPIRLATLFSEFVWDNLYPAGGPVMDRDPWTDLVRDIAWCDQHVQVLALLLSTHGVPTRQLHLNTLDSPPLGHVIAEVYLDQDWRVLDPLFGLVLRKRDGTLATFRDLTEDFSILTSHPLVDALPPDAKAGRLSWYGKLLSGRHWKSMAVTGTHQSRLKGLVREAIKTWANVFGMAGSHAFQSLHLSLLPDRLEALDFDQNPQFPVEVSRAENPALFLYFQARNYHLYRRVDKAEAAYRALLDGYPESPYAEKARFFLALIELELRQNAPGTIAQLNEFLQLHPKSAWLPRALYTLGKAYEGAADLEQARRYYLEASTDPFVGAASRLRSLDPEDGKGLPAASPERTRSHPEKPAGS